MKYLLFWVSFCLVQNYCIAHAPNEAFFEIFESDDQLLLKAEFPWTIREVLLTAKPELKMAQTTAQMEAGLLAYIQERLSIKNEKNQIVKMQTIQVAPVVNGHGHGSVYILRLGKNEGIRSVNNTCMFEAYINQVNYHSIKLRNMDTLKFVTHSQQSIYTIPKPKAANRNFLMISIGTVGALLLLILTRRSKVIRI